MAEESSKNYRDFFSVIFIPHTDLGHHPQDGIEGHKREGSKTQIYVSSFFVCLKVGQKKNPAAHQLLVVSHSGCSHSLLFCQSSWNEGGFLSSISFDLKTRIKTYGSLCSLLPLPWFVLWSGLLPPLLRAELLISF